MYVHWDPPTADCDIQWLAHKTTEVIILALGEKKEAHGIHCSLEKQFQSIYKPAQSYDYTITV